MQKARSFLFLVFFLFAFLFPPLTSSLYAYPGPEAECTRDGQPDPNNPNSTHCNDVFRKKAQQWYEAVYVSPDMNLQSYVNEVVFNILFTLSSLIVDVKNFPPSPQDLTNGFTEIIDKSQLSFKEKSEFFASVPTTGFDLFYRFPPASGTRYIAHSLQNFSIIPQTYAQTTGFGYTQFSSFLDIWRLSRNAAYMFFMVAFILLGFAIMFRIKLSAQSLATIQSLLPKVIITLILITFSYAIVGLLVDLMYVVSYLLINFMADEALSGKALMTGLIALLIPNGFEAEVGSTVLFHMPFVVSAIIPIIAVMLASFVVASFITFIFLLPVAIVGLLFPVISIGSLVGSGIVGLVISLIMLIIGLITIVKIFVILLKAYLAIFVALITGPLQMLGNFLPGSKSVSGWIKGIVGNLAVFPTIYLMFMLIEALLGNSLDTTGTWIPPLFLPNPAVFTDVDFFVNLAGFLPAIFIRSFLIVGVFLLIPKAAEIIKGMIEGKMPSLETALGQSFNTVNSLGQFGTQVFSGELDRRAQQAASAGITLSPQETAVRSILQFLKLQGKIK